MHTKPARIIVTFLTLLAMSVVPIHAADQSATGPAHVTAMISVSNLDRSIDYYTRLIGLKEANRIPLGGGAFEVILSPSGKRVYRYAHFRDPDGYTVEFTYFDSQAR